MSTAPFYRTRQRRTDCLLLGLAALAVCASACARSSDREQAIEVSADRTLLSQDKGIAILTGHVQIKQGSLLASGEHGKGVLDPQGNLQRMDIDGTPARFQQQLDDGSMVHGSAASVTYIVSANTVILAGDAIVVQEGKGRFQGAKLTYRTDSGEIAGDGGGGDGRVHMSFPPRAQPVAAPTPAPTPSPAATKPVAVPRPASSASSSAALPPAVPSPSPSTH